MKICERRIWCLLFSFIFFCRPVYSEYIIAITCELQRLTGKVEVNKHDQVNEYGLVLRAVSYLTTFFLLFCFVFLPFSRFIQHLFEKKTKINKKEGIQWHICFAIAFFLYIFSVCSFTKYSGNYLTIFFFFCFFYFILSIFILHLE